jgi:hypothetical protein
VDASSKIFCLKIKKFLAKDLNKMFVSGVSIRISFSTSFKLSKSSGLQSKHPPSPHRTVCTVHCVQGVENTGSFYPITLALVSIFKHGGLGLLLLYDTYSFVQQIIFF